MHQVVACESGYNHMVQSHHRYTATNVPKGYNVGDREQSYGLVQIHLPAHPHVSHDEAIDPEFATEFLARNLAAGRGSMWSCYPQKVALH